jgi:branched-chain amino acid transport system substrate-binding protein
MGDNHPFPNSPKDACLAYATELGFDIVPPIQYSMRPGDYKAQCLTLKESGADAAYLANTGDSNISLLKSCETVGVKPKFYTNVWGFSELVIDAAGQGAAGVTAPYHVSPWGMASGPGAKLVSDISSGKPRTPYYVAAVCSVFYLKEAMEWADKNGGITGEKVREGMYQKKDWVPKGLEGQCAPATWTASDHRSMTKVTLWEGQFKDGKAGWKRLTDITLPRDATWFGR